MIKYFSAFLSVFVLALVFTPSVALAQSGSSPIWDGGSYSYISYQVDCNEDGPCNFCHALQVSINIIDFLTTISIALATLMISAGGIMLMVGGGNKKWYEMGKSMVTNAIIGMVIILASWLIVNTLVDILGGTAPNPLNDAINCSA